MSKVSRYLPDFVYGGVDGTITTFAIVAGTVGAGLSPSIILILGFANLFADGFSMAASSYLSDESEKDLEKKHHHIHHPLTTALTTFISFVGIGLIPLVPFVLGAVGILLPHDQMVYASILAGLVFFSIGAIRGRVAGKSMLNSALSTFLVGAIAAAIAFYMGAYIESLV